MAKREVAQQYAGSVLGLAWAVLQPLSLITIFWVVFGLGFRTKPLQDAPFVVWLTAGMAPWFFFAEAVTAACGSVVQYAPLIKKTPFQSQILPLVKVLAALLGHAIFLFLLLILLVFHHMPVTFFFFQAAYYLVGIVLLGLGIGWIVAALNPFLRDMGQVVALVLQIGFWATPIMWQLEMLPAALRPFFLANPVAFAVQGYRDSFIYGVGFWDRPWLETAAFWACALGVFALGGIVFRSLKPHFADVL